MIKPRHTFAQPKQCCHQNRQSQQLFEKMIALLFLGVSKILHPESSPSHDSLAVAPASSSHTRSYTKLTSHEVHYRYPPCPRWGCCDWKCCCCQCQGRDSYVIWEASFGCRIGCMPGASSPRVNSRGAPLQTTPTWNNTTKQMTKLKINMLSNSYL